MASVPTLVADAADGDDERRRRNRRECSILATQTSVEVSNGELSESDRRRFAQEVDLSSQTAQTESLPSCVAVEALSRLRIQDGSSNQTTAAGNDSASSEKERQLLKHCPNAVPMECRRFLAEHGESKRASKKLAAYLAWRDAHGVAVARGGESDEETWNRCARAALAAEGVTDEDAKLPRIVRLLGSSSSNIDGRPPTPAVARDLDGKRTLHVLPAMLDANIAHSSTYSLCTALYIDSILRRESSEKMTIVVDVRPGRGWPNPAPLSIVPYVKMLSHIGADFFPERLWRCVVFPLPKVAMWIWRIVKGVLDKRHAARVRLVTGPAHARSPVPEKKMREYFSEDALRIMENSRVASFC